MGLDFFVVTDIYMTPTAELADIVLPAATWPEVDQVVGVPFGANKAVLVQQKAVEMYESRPDEWILLELAKRLNLPFGSLSLEEIFDYMLAPLGVNFRKLKKLGYIVAGTEYKKYERKGFMTPSRKVEIYSKQLEKLGYDPLPYYMEPPESPISSPEVAKEYPLILTTGSRVRGYFHSEGRQIASLRKLHPDPLVEINPKTADESNIKDGDWVYIETLRGRVKMRAKIIDGIHPKVVNAEHGWWFPENSAPEYGLWESNVNVLTSDAPPYDPAVGTYQLRALLCRIYKV
jgi:anaerobic selenocysteine-containing dehydrogenase